MNILIACEESQAVCKAFRNKGHRAFSCDIMEQSGGHPEWHIKEDVLPLLNGNCTFKTCDGKEHTVVGKWDMILAFPPCTHLAVSGARHFEKKRADGRQREGIEFFCQFLMAECEKISIENPVNIISGEYVKTHFPDLARKYNLPIKPTQYIQPYWFGDRKRKKTGLWLKGLKPLEPTEIVEPEPVTYIKANGKKTTFSKDYSKPDSFKRSKTPPGLAEAMAEQRG